MWHLDYSSCEKMRERRDRERERERNREREREGSLLNKSGRTAAPAIRQT